MFEKTNIYKTVDNMGRILIAKTLREKIGIGTGSELMLSAENGYLVIEEKKDNFVYSAVLDSVSRIVIPKSIRENLGMQSDSELEFFLDGQRLILMLKDKKCVFCESKENLYLYFNKPICAKCIAEIKEMARGAEEQI